MIESTFRAIAASVAERRNRWTMIGLAMLLGSTVGAVRYWLGKPFMSGWVIVGAFMAAAYVIGIVTWFRARQIRNLGADLADALRCYSEEDEMGVRAGIPSRYHSVLAAVFWRIEASQPDDLFKRTDGVRRLLRALDQLNGVPIEKLSPDALTVLREALDELSYDVGRNSDLEPLRGLISELATRAMEEERRRQPKQYFRAAAG